MIRKYLLILCALLLTPSAYAGMRTNEVEIPRTAYRDIYKYYVLEESKNATLFNVTIKRLGYDTMLFIKVEINCPSRVIRQMGQSVVSAKAITTGSPSQWIKPTLGMVEADIINYVCR